MRSLLKIAIVASLLSACVTPPPAPPKKKKKVQKTEEKNLTEESNKPAPVLPQEDTNFYLRVSDLQNTLSTKDAQDLLKLSSNTERGPLQRAILLFGALRAFVHQGVTSLEFEQAAISDPNAIQGKNWALISSLEELFKETRLSIKGEFESNLFIQNFTFVSLLIRAIEQDADKTSNFITELRTELNEKASQWVQVQDKLKSQTESSVAASPSAVTDVNSPNLASLPPASGSSTVPAATTAPNTNTNPPEQKIDPTTLKDSELVKKSLELAEKHNFLESVQLLRRVPASSLYNSEAKTKLRDIANKAVSELRIKAARSYQSSIPITDLKARSNYLAEAQSYLQEALREYPESDQIETVKQNLSTIEKSLKVINKR